MFLTFLIMVLMVQIGFMINKDINNSAIRYKTIVATSFLVLFVLGTWIPVLYIPVLALLALEIVGIFNSDVGSWLNRTISL